MSKLDDLFKDKFEDRELPFNEALWEAARQMIDAQERRKRRGWWLFAMIGLLLGSLAAYWLMQPERPASNADQMQLIERPADVKEQQRETVETLSDNGKSGQNKSDFSTSANATVDENEVTAFNDVKKPATAISGNTNLKSNDSKYTASQIPNTNSSIPRIEKNKTSSSVTNKIPRPDQPANLPGAKEDMVDNKNSQTPIPEKAEGETVAQNKIATFDLLDIDYKALESPERKPDSKIKALRQSHFSWGIKAGLPIHAPGNQKSTLIGAVAGVQFLYSFNPRWQLGAELLYTYRDGHFNRSKTSEQLSYRFGKEVANYQLLPANLHYLSLPIYVQHRWNAYGVEAGIAPTLLTGARGTVLADPTESSNPGKAWIEPHGFKKFHAQLFLGMRYHVPRGWDIGFRAIYAPSGILKGMDIPDSEKILLESDRLIYNILITKKL